MTINFRIWRPALQTEAKITEREINTSSVQLVTEEILMLGIFHLVMAGHAWQMAES